MAKKEHQVPLAGGHRAGTRYAVQQPSTRAILQWQAQQRIRREHLTRRVHRLGARVLFELLDELDRHHGLGDDLDRRLGRFAAIDADMLRRIGGDSFAPAPTRVVGGGR